MAEIEKMDLESFDVVGDRLERMRELFPEVFSESGIDFEKLRLSWAMRLKTATSAMRSHGRESGTLFVRAKPQAGRR